MSSEIRRYGDLLRTYLGRYRVQAVLVAVALLANLSLKLINPQLAKRFVDALVDGRPASELIHWATLFVGLAIGQQLTGSAAAILGTNVGWLASNALRLDLARHCLHLDLSFHKAHTPGEMIERIDGDMTSLSEFFGQFVVSILGNSLLVIGLIVMMWRIDWRIGIAVLAFTAIAGYILGRLQSRSANLWDQQREADAEMFGYIEERLAATEDIRSLGAVPYVMNGLYDVMRRATWRWFRAGFVGAGLTHNTTYLLGIIVTALSIAMGGILYLRGEATLGTVYLLYSYSSMLVDPLAEISRRLQDLQKAAAGVRRASRLLALRSRITRSRNPQPLSSTTGPWGLRFEQVGFGYHDTPLSSEGAAIAEADEPDQAVLRNVSFEVGPGRVLGLLGRTGSGKTTIGRLLLRLYDPQVGRIALSVGQDEVDLVSAELGDLRRRVGVVTQTINLFQASIRDNLTLFDTSIDDSALLAVLGDLGLSPWLARQEHGLDTEISAGGSGLSAGEGQLLAFARIFLADPQIVLLDEASSRLDPATEQLLERAVDRLLEHRTGIIIAHRLSTVLRADDILILEEGRVAEFGPRKDLQSDPNSRFSALLRTGIEEALA